VHETATGAKRVQTVLVDRESNDAIRIVPELHPIAAGGSGRGQLHVTCDGNHVEGSPFGVSLQPTKWIWNQLSKAPAEGPADRHTPIYGEINETGVAKILAWWRDNAGLGADSVFMEAGSGRGKPCFLAKLQFDVGTVVGVEVVPERRFIAEYLRRVLLRSGISSMDEMSFLVSDLCVGAASPVGSAIAAAGEHDDDIEMDRTPWSALTHWYTFDTGFPPDVMEAVGKLINSLVHRGGELEHFACFHSPERLGEHGFDMKALRLAHKTIVNMEGSAQGHTCYVYSTNPELALEKWTEDEGLYVDPDTLEMICSSSEEDSDDDDDDPQPVSPPAEPQAGSHTWLTMQIQVPKGMVPGQVCKIFDPDGRPHFIKIPRECRPLPGKSVSDLHFIKQVPKQYTTSVLRTLDRDELRQWLRHRRQKLPGNTRHEVLLDVACDYINQAQNPAPSVPKGWQTHWSGEYKRWYFVHAESQISCWEHPQDRSDANANPSRKQAAPKARPQTSRGSRTGSSAGDDTPQLYAELFSRIPRPKTERALAQEFNDRELRIIMKFNGMMINNHNPVTDKYVEKSKLEKCQTLAATPLKRPEAVTAELGAAAKSSPKMSKAQLSTKLPRDLNWNEFQREAVAAGYPNSNTKLAEAWRHYKRPPAAQREKSATILTAAQRQTALTLSQSSPGMSWNDFQCHGTIQAMFDRLDGGIVNKNALMAGVWRQYQADQQPAAAAQTGRAAQHPPLQRVAFVAGDKVVWICWDHEVAEGEIGVCTGNCDQDGDPELKFSPGGWVGCLPSEELIKLPNATYVPNGLKSVPAPSPASIADSGSGSGSDSASETSVASIAASAASATSAEQPVQITAAMQRRAVSRLEEMRKGAGKITDERFDEVQAILRSTMLLDNKVAAISLALHRGRKDINLQDFTDVIIASGLPVTHYTPDAFRNFWRGSDPYHGAPLKKAEKMLRQETAPQQSSSAVVTIPVPIAAPTLTCKVAALASAPVPHALPDTRLSSVPSVEPLMEFDGSAGWTVPEEELLVNYVMKHGARQWDNCAAEIGTGRTGSACGQHYRTHLRPVHGHKEGTLAMDEHEQPERSLENAVPTSKQQPASGRTSTRLAAAAGATAAAVVAASSAAGTAAVPVDYRQIAGGWKQREEEALVEHIERRGVGNWDIASISVSAVGKGRSSSSCRSHYFDVIAPRQQHAKSTGSGGAAPGEDIYASLPSGLDWNSFQTRIRVFGNAASKYWQAYCTRASSASAQGHEREHEQREGQDAQESDSEREDDDDDESDDEEDESQGMNEQEDEDEDQEHSAVAGTAATRPAPAKQRSAANSGSALRLAPSTSAARRGALSKAQLSTNLPQDLNWNEFQREAVAAGYPNSNTKLAEAWRHYKGNGGGGSSGGGGRGNKRAPASPVDAPPPKKQARAMPPPAAAARPVAKRPAPRPASQQGQQEQQQQQRQQKQQRQQASASSSTFQQNRFAALQKRPSGTSAGGRRGRVRKQVVRAGMVDITRPGISLVRSKSCASPRHSPRMHCACVGQRARCAS
jgi:hypothetical protein